MCMYSYSHTQSDSLEATNDRSEAEAYLRNLQVSDGVQALTLRELSCLPVCLRPQIRPSSCVCLSHTALLSIMEPTVLYSYVCLSVCNEGQGGQVQPILHNGGNGKRFVLLH